MVLPEKKKSETLGFLNNAIALVQKLSILGIVWYLFIQDPDNLLTFIFDHEFYVNKKTNSVVPADKSIESVATYDPINGLDISHYQKDIMQSIYRDEDLEFIICKATQGNSFKDSRFKENWKMIRERGLIKGAYHFYVNDKDPIEQAKHYVAAVKETNPDKPPFFNALPPILDIEDDGLKSKTTAPALQRELLIWLDEVERLTGQKPIIYSSNYFLNQYLNNPKFGEYGLWIAEWNDAREPRIPKAWTGKKWTFWQKSDSYQHGVQQVDFDVFNGTHQQLINLTK